MEVAAGFGMKRGALRALRADERFGGCQSEPARENCG
jgi:hypothetical protein